MANDPAVRISALEELAKEIGPDLGMFIAQWAAQQQMGVEQEPLSTLVVRRIREKLSALIAGAREGAKPEPIYKAHDSPVDMLPDGRIFIPLASAGEPIVIGRASFASPPSATDMQAIMADDGHPDEGPCVVCGHVFDAHNPGCVFETAGTEREPGTPYLRTALVAAKGVIDIAASYDPEEWPTVGLKVHCRDARKVKAIIDDALAANPADTEGPLSEDAIAAILGRYLQLSMDNHAEYQTSKHHAGKWDDCTEIGCNNDRYLIGRLRAALVERREEMSYLTKAEADAYHDGLRDGRATPPADAGLREILKDCLAFVEWDDNGVRRTNTYTRAMLSRAREALAAAPAKPEAKAEAGEGDEIYGKYGATIGRTARPAPGWVCDCGKKGGEIGEMLVGPDNTLIHWTGKEWCHAHGPRPAPTEGLREAFVAGFNAAPGLPIVPNLEQIAAYAKLRDALAERRYPLSTSKEPHVDSSNGL